MTGGGGIRLLRPFGLIGLRGGMTFLMLGIMIGAALGEPEAGGRSEAPLDDKSASRLGQSSSGGFKPQPTISAIASASRPSADRPPVEDGQKILLLMMMRSVGSLGPFGSFGH